MNNSMPPQFKLATVIVMWVVIAAIMMGLIITGYLTSLGFFGWITALGMVGIGAGVTTTIFEGEKNSGEKKPLIDVHLDTTKGKAKRGENLEQLMALLDEDDLYELRQRIKSRLIGQIDEGSDEEVESFDQLLSSRDRLKRK